MFQQDYLLRQIHALTEALGWNTEPNGAPQPSGNRER